jgi:YidC/Oxa1 family membrane protein insertase
MRDNDTVRNLFIAAAVFFAVLYIGKELLPPPPQPPADTPQTGQAADDAPVPSDETGAAQQAAATAPPGEPQPPAETAARSPFIVKGTEEELTVSLGSAPTTEPPKGKKPKEDPYRMCLTLSNVGASIDTATMTDHKEELKRPDPYKLLVPVETEGGIPYRSLAVENVNIDRQDVPLHQARWTLRKEEIDKGERGTFGIQVEQDDAPVLKITRAFTLPQQSIKSGRHDLYCDLEVTNVSDTPRQIILTFGGGVGVPMADPTLDDRVVDYAIRSPAVNLPEGQRKKSAQISKAEDASIKLYEAATAQTGEHLSWAATANKYFTCTVAPLDPEGQGDGDYLSSLQAYDIDKSAETADDTALRFVTERVLIQPNETRSFSAAIYLGEKDHKSFKTIEEYKSRNYYYQIAKYIPFCTFSPLVELMIWLLNGMHSIWPHNFGLAIMVLVLIVRAILHPITKKGQVNMVRMQKKMGELQPKLEEIKKKYANDKTRLQQEQMKIYREEGVNPTGQLFTCLPMLLQMPIWVALFYSLRQNIDIRHQPFMLWIRDLTAQDALFTFSSPINVLIAHIESFNLLPILLAIAMYVQQKLMPKPKPNPNATDQQRQQQEMMQKMGPMMSIMMLVFFYKMPSGLNLYILSSTVLGALEQHFIRKHIKRHEEAGTLVKPAKKKGGMADQAQKRKLKMPGWWGWLQAAAERAQKQKLKR